MYTGAPDHPLMSTFACLMEALEHRVCMSVATPALSGAAQIQFDTVDHSINGFLNNTNNDDVFRFHLDKAATVNLNLTGLSGDATLQLIQDTNANNQLDCGETIVESNQRGTADESISRLLDGGNYCVRVVRSANVASAKYSLSYGMSLFTTPDKKDTVGDDAAHATVLNSTASNQTVVEYIGGADTADWYRLDLKTARTVNIRLNGLVYDANMSIAFDKNHNGMVDPGETIADTTGHALSDKAFAGKLQAGSYLFCIKAVNPLMPTTYALRVA